MTRPIRGPRPPGRGSKRPDDPLAVLEEARIRAGRRETDAVLAALAEARRLGFLDPGPIRRDPVLQGIEGLPEILADW